MSGFKRLSSRVRVAVLLVLGDAFELDDVELDELADATGELFII